MFPDRCRCRQENRDAGKEKEEGEAGTEIKRWR
jgi:hypothetical protein